MAAFADRTASPFFLWTGSVFALPTALANAFQFVEPLPDVLDLDFIETFGSQVRCDVQPDEPRVR